MIQGVLTDRPAVETNGAATGRNRLGAHYRALVQRIQAANLAAPASQTIEMIGVTSCARGAGVSTVAFNIAVAAARADMGPVLFVDTNVTKQASQRLITDSPTLGLADALAGDVDPMDCIVSVPVENLSIVAGRGAANHDELAFSPFRAVDLLNEYKCHCKLLVVDIPAPTDLNGSIYLAEKMDGVLLVIESELSEARTALRTKQQLIDANANLLGVVLNKQREYVPKWLHDLL